MSILLLERSQGWCDRLRLLEILNVIRLLKNIWLCQLSRIWIWVASLIDRLVRIKTRTQSWFWRQPLELIVVISKILHLKFLILIIFLFFLILLRLRLWHFTIVSHDCRLKLNMLLLFSILDNHALTLILTALSSDHHYLHLLLPRTVLILYHLSYMIRFGWVRPTAPLCDSAIRCAGMQFHLSVFIWKELLLMLIAILLLLILLGEGLRVSRLGDSTILLLAIGVADQVVGCQVCRVKWRVSMRGHHLRVELPSVLMLVASIVLGTVGSHVHFQILN